MCNPPAVFPLIFSRKMGVMGETMGNEGKWGGTRGNAGNDWATALDLAPSTPQPLAGAASPARDLLWPAFRPAASFSNPFNPGRRKQPWPQGKGLEHGPLLSLLIAYTARGAGTTPSRQSSKGRTCSARGNKEAPYANCRYPVLQILWRFTLRRLHATKK